jgi:hypothetical protein
MQMCGDKVGCIYLRTYEDADAYGHERMKIRRDMGGCRCVGT